MTPSRIGFLLCLGLTCGLAPTGAVQPAAKGYQKKVQVASATRIDWTFVLSNKSFAKLPADWTPKYDSTKQSYELFVPPDYDPKKPCPVVLFVSAGASPMGFEQFESICKEKGMIFVSPHDAGNDCNEKKRVRIVMDVLDEVRRKYRTDPDRTYIAGFSGGARIALGIACALPEYFGGVIPICAAGEMRDEPWLKQRTIDRLSVALLTGESDFNRGEVERWRGPVFKEMGVRTRVWVFPKMSHAPPEAEQLKEVVQWLDEGVKDRQEFAKKYPASRIAGDASPLREEAGKALFAEGKERMKNKETFYSGLMQLHGCMIRWDGLPVAAEAKKIVAEYDAMDNHPWKQQDIAEQRRYLIACARAMDGYCSGDLPKQYAKDRVDMAKAALTMWQLIVKDGQDANAVKEAQARIPELNKIIEGKGP